MSLSMHDHKWDIFSLCTDIIWLAQTAQTTPNHHKPCQRGQSMNYPWRSDIGESQEQHREEFIL